MRTEFSLAQLADPDTKASEGILRACVHCGFCTATCPTYVLLGDERDSPRGRIYLIKNMLESDGPVDAAIVPHIDRCLSCLSCMTTCPSGVNYMHLVDHARRYLEERYRRPWLERGLRRLLAEVLPRPALFRWSLVAALAARPVARLLPGRLGAMLRLAPRRLPPPSAVDRPQVFAAVGPRRRRVALLSGCAQQVLTPQFNEATVRLLTRHGCEVVVAPGSGCCGALGHHLGRHSPTLEMVRANIAAWCAERDGEGLDAVVINASGCGTMVKDYGFMLRDDAAWGERAAWVSERARDVSELMAELGLRLAAPAERLTIAYQSPCSLQHGQKVSAAPKGLLAEAGFTVVEPAEAHLCCGSAGTYNILQPAIAARLKARKVANLERLGADAIATGNVGCAAQIAQATRLPVVHTAELLDWASGGPRPEALSGRAGRAADLGGRPGAP